ncbi:MAG TPA: PIG-L family deacetylase, partial [Candidatus Dormibacteraeota bacterium]|nr:PIG-L family deacetylase [Candidatus Dormibacteraeota bacterium]
YVTAHPDDESAAMLTYLARGLHAEVALLSLTRGEGGQNALGPEQAPQLGLIRTQELLAATRGYGVKLYFTRARDFGYSKTPEETEKIWGDQVMEDMVRVIRSFRPNIVINNQIGGHGHHVAADRLTPKAVQIAADPKAYPQITSDIDGLPLSPWGPNGNAVKVFDVDRGSRKPNSYVLPVDDVSPLYGKSYREIGLDAFTNHRTQGITGFINSPFLSLSYGLVAESGEPFDPQILAVHLQDWSPDQRVAQIAKQIQAARDAVFALDWNTAAKSLADARMLLNPAVPDPYSPAKPSVSDPEVFDYWKLAQRLDRAMALTAGLQLSADANRSDLVVGETVEIVSKQKCRPEVPCGFAPNQLQGPSPNTAGVLEETKRAGEATGQVTLTAMVHQPPATPDPAVAVLPEPPSLAVISQPVTIFGYQFQFRQPVTHITATTMRAERIPLRIVPAYTLSVQPPQVVEVLAKEKMPLEVLLRVHSHATQPGKITVGLQVPNGWTSSAPVPLEFSGAGDQYARLKVSAQGKLAAGNYTISAYAMRGQEKFTSTVEPLVSMSQLLWTSPAECVVHAFDVNVPANLRVGYISAESEPVPEALSRLGIRVDALDAAGLNFGDLSKFDAIVVGVRAYELRPELPGANQRLLDYVSQGGTLVVQYQRDFAWDKFRYAPYPAKIDGAGGPLPRITDENAEVKFLKPDDPLLNVPNKITPRDFQGWIQERGLYFWTQFDSKYTPLLSMHDPNEADLNGGLVYTRYGKGTYVYTGLAFFRQLPEGVPGAYRFFVNLISATHEETGRK